MLIAAGGAPFLAGAAEAQPAPRFPIVGGPGRWSVDSQNRTGDAKFADFLGRPSLWLKAGTQVTREGVSFADGTIAFDMAPMAEGDFVGVTFRREGFDNHENVYLRLSRSGEFMALQYAPRMNGSSTWQLYPEFCRQTDWPRLAWTRVRLEIAGSELAIYVGDESKPVLQVPRLRHRSGSGEAALWARVNERPAEWAAALANIEITPAADAAPRRGPAAPPDGYIARWQVAGPIRKPADLAAPPPADALWQAVDAEESGLVNLNRLFRASREGPQAAYAQAKLTSATTRAYPLSVGYSDDVAVLVNGRPVYRGANAFNSRQPRFASFVDARFETVWLPLEAGENRLTLAVADDQAFGWGFAARLEDANGVRLS
jgi:hypothetical protein